MNVARMSQYEKRMMKAAIIEKTGKKCQGCGHPFTGHQHKLARQNGAMELDHKIPKARGGADEISNFQVLCLPCHDGKTNENGRTGKIRNMTDLEWRAAGRPQDWIRKRRLTYSRLN